MDIITDGVDRPRRLRAAPEDSEARVVRMAPAVLVAPEDREVPEGGKDIADKVQPSFHIRSYFRPAADKRPGGFLLH